MTGHSDPRGGDLVLRGARQPGKCGQTHGSNARISDFGPKPSQISVGHFDSLTLIARFALEIAHFVCDHATTIENEKLCIAMYAYSVSAYYMYTGNKFI